MTSLPVTRAELLFEVRDLVDTALIEGRATVEIETVLVLQLIAPDFARMRAESATLDTQEYTADEMERAAYENQCDAPTQPVKAVGL